MDLFAGGLSPLPGGRSEQTFLAEMAGERSVVRVYARPDTRGAHGFEIDVALLTLLRGIVPVAEVLEVKRPQGEMPALLVTSFLPGLRLDELLPVLDEGQLARVGTAVGGVLARLAGIPMLRAGEYADGELQVRPFPPGEATVGRAVLVHGDLTPARLLVDPESLAITGVIGWEAAHAGSPVHDLETVTGWAPGPLAAAARAAYALVWG